MTLPHQALRRKRKSTTRASSKDEDGGIQIEISHSRGEAKKMRRKTRKKDKKV